MKYAMGKQQMMEIDRYTAETIGIPTCVLMEKAAMAVAAEAEKMFAKEDRLLAVCGTGNNGGDGIAAARILYTEGYSVTVLLAGDRKSMTKEAKRQLKIAKNLGVPVTHKAKPAEYNGIIDALFGIGLSRLVTGSCRRLIEEINASAARVLAVDVPSGVQTDDGRVMGCAVRAEVTVTFGYQKIGCLLYPGAEYAGTVVIKEIGFAPHALAIQPNHFTFDELPGELLPKRQADANKGTYGRVLVIAGSKNMSGAAYFAAAAAYRMGAGLVRILTARENREILQRQLPEAILTTYDGENGELSAEDREAVREAVAWASVLLVGPGLGISAISAGLVNYVLSECHVPLVIDADGLNILSRLVTEHVPAEAGTAGRIACIASLLPAGTILTPHKKELSVLTGIPLAELVTGLLESSADCTNGNALIYVKKDVRTIVSFGNSHYINITGNDGMATAGSGDVLGGMIAGLLAQGELPKMAAMTGCYLHGMAGDEAARRKGRRSMLASDILDAIPAVLEYGR